MRDWHEGSPRTPRQPLTPRSCFSQRGCSRPRARDLPVTFDAARKLADIFEVSLTATAVSAGRARSTRRDARVL